MRAQHCDCRYHHGRQHRRCAGRGDRLPWWKTQESDSALLWWGHLAGRAALIATRTVMRHGARLLVSLATVATVLILAGALGLLASAAVSMAR